MNVTAYFDANVYDHLDKRDGVTEEDLNDLRQVVRAARIRILVSDQLIDELVSTLGSSPELGREQIRLLLELADFSGGFLRPPGELMIADLRAYAKGRKLPYRLRDAGHVRLTSEWLQARAKGDPSDILPEIFEQTRAQKEEFRSSMTAGQRAVAQQIQELHGRVPDFEREYRPAISNGLIERFAKQARLYKRCKRRGLDGVASLSNVVMYGDATASLVYSQTFEGRRAAIGDSRDMLHAVSAAEADVFVTDDRKLRRVLGRVSVARPRVLSLPEFLDTYIRVAPE